jgi:HK97 family phage major capsid protein
MPSVLATTGNPTNAITFADWQKFYRIVNRINLMLLRDPYTVEGSVVFKTRQRVGGNIENGIAGVTLAVPV